MEFTEIEHERRKYCIPVARLCSAAGINVRSYQRIRSGEREALPDTLAKLSAAIAPVRRQERPLPAQKLFRLVCAMMALEADIDVNAVLAYEPKRKATSDPDWMAISRIRGNAIYVLRVVLGLSGKEVALAAGVSEANVTIVTQKLEGRRDQQGMDRIFSQLEKAVAG